MDSNSARVLAEVAPRLLQRLPARLRPVVVVGILGLVAGCAAVLFHLAIHYLYQNGLEALTHRSRTTFLVGSFLLLAGTSAISGWLLTRFCPEAAGSGIPQVKLAFWKDFGYIPWKVVWVKFIGAS